MKSFLKLLLPKSFYIMIMGDIISRIGDYIYILGIPTYVLYLTNSPIWMGISFGVQQSAVIFSGFLSGTIVDRNHPRKILIINAILQAVLVSLIPIFHALSLVNIYFIIIDGFLLTSCSFLYKTSLNSLIPCIVIKENLPLASSQISISKFFSKTIGPVLAGLSITLFTPINSLWIDAASFFIVFLLMYLIDDKKDLIVNFENKASKTNFIDDIKTGFFLVVQTKHILMLILLNFMLNIGYVSMFSMFIFHLKQTLNLSSNTIGFIYSIDGIAVIIAGMLLPVLMNKLKNNTLISMTSIVMGICILSLGYATNVVLIGLLFCSIMYCSQTINRVMYTSWQMNFSIEYLGRIFSISSMLESLSVPLAGIISGIIVNKYNSFILFRLSGISMIVSSVLFILFAKIFLLENQQSIEI